MKQSILIKLIAGTLVALTVCGCTPAAKKARMFKRAEADFNAGKYEYAKVEYLALLRAGMENDTILLRIGTMWLEQGAPLRAFPFLLRAQNLAPENVAVRERLAFAYLSLGQVAEARKEAITILQKAPANVQALLYLSDAARSPEDLDAVAQQLEKFPAKDTASFHLASANVAMRKGDAAGAENSLKLALAADPKAFAPRLAMANFYMNRKDPVNAGKEFKAAAESAPPRSGAGLSYAEFKMQNGETAEARTILQKITQQAPDYLPATLLLAQISFKEKKYDETLSAVADVLARDERNVGAYLLRAQAWEAKGEPAKALKELTSLDTIFPGLPMVKYELAKAHLQNNDSAQAISALNQAITINPSFTEATLTLADLNLQMGHPQTVVTPMLDLLKKQPALGQAEMLLAKAYQLLGRLDDAAGVMRGQIKAYPKNGPSYLLLGMIQRQQKNGAEARKNFEKALELNPNDSLALSQIVDLDLEEKNPASALERVQSQIKATPISGAAHYLKGKILAAQGDWNQAEPALMEALKLDPNILPAYDLLVSHYVNANKLPQAVAELQDLLVHEPKNLGALMILGKIEQDMNDIPKAKAAYERVLEIRPELAAVQNNLACLYADRLNQLDKAYEMARKARAGAPADPAIADTLGWIVFRRGEYQQAEALLQESATAIHNPEISYHLGMAKYMLGQVDAARMALREAVASPAEFPGKDGIKRRLAVLDAASSQEIEALTKEQPDDAIAWLRLSEIQEGQGDAVKAAAACEQALKINPNLLPAMVRLAQLDAGPLQKPDAGLQLAKRARELSPSDPKIAGILGRLAFQVGNYGWADGLLQESVRQPTAAPEVLHDSGWATYSQGRVPEARQIMQRFLDRGATGLAAEDAKSFLFFTALPSGGPDLIKAEPEIGKAMGSDPGYVPALMAGAALAQVQGKTKEAGEAYEKVLRRFPDFAPAQAGLAAALAGQPDQAPRAYDLAVKARKTLPNDPELAETLAEISYRRKDYRYAIQLLQEKAKTAPLGAQSLFYLGMSLWQAKEPVAPRDALERAVAGGLTEPSLTEAQRVLAELKKKK